MTNEVSVQRKDLLEAFRPLRLVKNRKDVPEAIVSMEGDTLCFSVIGMSTYANAEGSWTGEVRIPGAFLLALAKMPPPGDPVVVAVREGRLHFGALSTACVEQASWKSEIPLPLDPSLSELLRLRYLYTAERIERAGLKIRVEDAHDRAAKLLGQAAKSLAPLDITREDLRDLLVKKLES